MTTRQDQELTEAVDRMNSAKDEAELAAVLHGVDAGEYRGADAYTRRHLITEAERERQEEGRESGFKSPYYSQEVADMSDEDLQESLKEAGAVSSGGDPAPAAVEAERQRVARARGEVNQEALSPEDFDQALREAKSSREINELMQRQGLSVNYD